MPGFVQRLLGSTPTNGSSSGLSTRIWASLAHLARADAKAARSLIEQKRFAEADDVLEVALRVWTSRRLLKLHARSASESGRRELALERWKRLQAFEPDNPVMLSYLAESASQMHHLAYAEKVIDDALARFPHSLQFLQQGAALYDKCSAHAKAQVCWQRLIDVETNNPDWRAGLATNLANRGHFDEAERMLEDASTRHPNHRALLANRGVLALRRHDWDKAKAIWLSYQARYPDDIGGYDAYGRAVAAAAFVQDETATPAHQVMVGREEDEAARQLLLRFESVGRDCEFGLVQRRYGAEPISLLRWHALNPNHLVHALSERFTGLGEGELRISVDGQGQYEVSDMTWLLGLYTFIYKGSIDEAELESRMRRRLLFLKGKFLSDIEEAEKTLVMTIDPFDKALIGRIGAALASIGPIRLLVLVAVGDRQAPRGQVGQVIHLGDNLYLGYLGQLGKIAGNWDIQFKQWLAVLKGYEAINPPRA